MCPRVHKSADHKPNHVKVSDESILDVDHMYKVSLQSTWGSIQTN